MPLIEPHLTLSSLCYGFGYLAGVAAFCALAIHRRMDAETLLTVLAVGLACGLLGAFAVQWIVTGESGRTIIGGFATGYLGVWLYKRWKGISMETGDFFAVAMSAGEMVGRWGCYFGGCCYGRKCDLPWAIFQHGAMRHPTQIYMSIAAGIILAILLFCESRRPPIGLLFYVQGTLFCLFRFIIEFFREGDRVYHGYSAAQIGCACGALFFGSMLISLLSRTSRLPRAIEARQEKVNV